MLTHGDGPNGCDALGGREAIVTAVGNQFVLHYDGCAPPGWRASQTLSPGLSHWTKTGPIRDPGTPGSNDATSGSRGSIHRSLRQR